MVAASITLSVIAVVVSFILGVLGAFPLSDGSTIGSATPGDDKGSSTFSSADVQRAGDSLLLGYTDIISDIASFQKDPDLERAEARKRAMIEYAEGLLGRYEGLSDDLTAEMDELAPRSAE
ncbi:MAG: hypothetical protein FJZ95_05035 [Chloroflexi bacterium]|nr:hypothetical protein [Chloroflexota bacterium]